jgi:hypothetical protein
MKKIKIPLDQNIRVERLPMDLLNSRMKDLINSKLEVWDESFLRNITFPHEDVDFCMELKQELRQLGQGIP